MSKCCEPMLEKFTTGGGAGPTVYEKNGFVSRSNGMMPFAIVTFTDTPEPNQTRTRTLETTEQTDRTDHKRLTRGGGAGHHRLGHIVRNVEARATVYCDPRSEISKVMTDQSDTVASLSQAVVCDAEFLQRLCAHTCRLQRIKEKCKQRVPRTASSTSQCCGVRGVVEILIQWSWWALPDGYRRHMFNSTKLLWKVGATLHSLNRRG